MTRGRPGDHELEAARELIRQLFAAALNAVDPRQAVGEALSPQGDSLTSGGSPIAEQNVHVIAVGKAAVAMTMGALDALGEQIISGDVITKDGHANAVLPDLIRVHQAGHPIPDARGVRATRLALEKLGSLPDDVVVLALVSGGGSALLEAPRDGLSLQDLAITTDLLLRAGAPIEDLNAVRAPLSQVKAGGLRAAAPGAKWVTLILSDVLGNDPRVIASGPTVPLQSDRGLALQVVDRYQLRTKMPAAVVAALGRAPERGCSALDHDILRVVGHNAAAVAAAASAANERGLETRVVWHAAEGEAATLGRGWVTEIAGVPSKVDVLLGGGETTVTVRGDGRGGRNTEFALAGAIELERLGIEDWGIASLATDGQDALTGLAGAIADANTCHRARERGVDPEAALRQNDSLAVFEAAGGAVDTGPTGTNVNDLYFAVRVQDRLTRNRGGD
jgi:hydroxypyruvate reductase